jgi:endonuclease/exonuclease/phosphatase family metal-dependent hydrolase
MKRKLTFSILILILCAVIPQNISSQKLMRFMSFNIRYDNPGDGENAWTVRKDHLINQVKFYEPDIMGIQEGLSHQVLYIDNNINYLDYVGVGRDDGKEKGEYSAIFYNKNRYNVLESNTFWLSDTPDKISVGWDASMERICTYALFENKETKEKFWVFNTHYDHRGRQARENSSMLILDQIEMLNKQDYPVILMGDFNALPESKTIQTVLEKLKDSKEVSKIPTMGPVGTFNNFDILHKLEKRIDYIFVSETVSVRKYAVLSNINNQKFTSDHLAVFVEIESLK